MFHKCEKSKDLSPREGVNAWSPQINQTKNKQTIEQKIASSTAKDNVWVDFELRLFSCIY